jgi:2-amino-4-hydroxy-6-hydroxymethyldihydropteridine diphosphokinase
VRRVAFGFGSNVGDKQRNLEQAMAALFSSGDIHFLRASSFYRTAPWGHEEQDWFVNACALGETMLSAHELLARCKLAERQVGRVETFRWGPRIIDVDILWIEGEEVADPDLVVPHRDLLNRAFVLVPLAEICPDLTIAGRGVAAEAASIPGGAVTQAAPPWRS